MPVCRRSAQRQAILGAYRDDSQERAERAFLGLEWQRQVSPRHQFKVSLYGQYNNEDINLDLCYRDPITGTQGPGGGLFFSQELRDLYLANNSDIDQTLAAAGADPGIQNRYATLQASGAQAFCDFRVLRGHVFDEGIRPRRCRHADRVDVVFEKNGYAV